MKGKYIELVIVGRTALEYIIHKWAEEIWLRI